MALRSAAPRVLLRRLFSTTSASPFIPPLTPAAAQTREQPEPSTNLFVSGLRFLRGKRKALSSYPHNLIWFVGESSLIVARSFHGFWMTPVLLFIAVYSWR
ncbi:hypothetical protein TIFTF001_003330 [Ficus carica]|uniref:Uncharacterized protein n=1 Tax=Ficus carica TaxID=3494 RepID=A0AA87ZR92_FICCA|nr:hypothetical protein TIFTF001_003330 [Ficus carica]